MTEATFDFKCVKAACNVYKTGRDLQRKVVEKVIVLIEWKCPGGGQCLTWEPANMALDPGYEFAPPQYSLCIETRDTSVPKRWWGCDNFPWQEHAAWEQGKAYNPSWKLQDWEQLQNLVSVEEDPAQASKAPDTSGNGVSALPLVGVDEQPESVQSAPSPKISSSTSSSQYVSVASSLGGSSLVSACLQHCARAAEEVIDAWFAQPGRPVAKKSFQFRLSPQKGDDVSSMPQQLLEGKMLVFDILITACALCAGTL